MSRAVVSLVPKIRDIRKQQTILFLSNSSCMWFLLMTQLMMTPFFQSQLQMVFRMIWEVFPSLPMIKTRMFSRACCCISPYQSQSRYLSTNQTTLRLSPMQLITFLIYTKSSRSMVLYMYSSYFSFQLMKPKVRRILSRWSSLLVLKYMLSLTKILSCSLFLHSQSFLNDASWQSLILFSFLNYWISFSSGMYFYSVGWVQLWCLSAGLWSLYLLLFSFLLFRYWMSLTLPKLLLSFLKLMILWALLTLSLYSSRYYWLDLGGGLQSICPEVTCSLKLFFKVYLKVFLLLYIFLFLIASKYCEYNSVALSLLPMYKSFVLNFISAKSWIFVPDSFSKAYCWSLGKPNYQLSWTDSKLRMSLRQIYLSSTLGRQYFFSKWQNQSYLSYFYSSFRWLQKARFVAKSGFSLQFYQKGSLCSSNIISMLISTKSASSLNICPSRRPLANVQKYLFNSNFRDFKLSLHSRTVSSTQTLTGGNLNLFYSFRVDRLSSVSILIAFFTSLRIRPSLTPSKLQFEAHLLLVQIFLAGFDNLSLSSVILDVLRSASDLNSGLELYNLLLLIL